MFNFLIYADDTTLSSTLNVFSDNTPDQNLESLINEELVKINDWLKINKLSLNVVKSKFMIFQKKKKNIQILNLKIDNVNIDQVKEFNFLGLIIDTNLNWKKHAEKISNACSKKIGILNKLKHILPLYIKKILYNSLIVPHINYCIMAWGFESNRIIKLQNKALRIITLSNYISHTKSHTMTYLAIYKIGGLCLNMRYMVMTQETKIKYTLIKLNMNLQRNVSDIICHYY